MTRQVLSVVGVTVVSWQSLSLNAPTPVATRVSSDAVVVATRAFVGWLQQVSPAADDAAGVDRITALEELQAAAAGAQLVEVDRLAAGRTDARGVAAQVGLATRVSVGTAERKVALADALVHDLPETLTLLQQGRISAWVASLVARETSALGPDDRQAADQRLAARLPRLGPREAEAAAKATAIAIDPASPLRRGRTARADRRVTLRPAPDTMSLLTGFLPVEQGVATYAALTQAATGTAGERRREEPGAAHGRHPGRTRHRTGHAPAVPVEVGVVIPLDSLLGDSDQPARVEAPGTVGIPIPAELATDIIDTSRILHAPVWLRRLLTDPDRPHHHHPRHPTPPLHRRTLETHHPARPDLPHPLLHRPDPPPRPHHPLARRRPHHRRQRPRALRHPQPHQRSSPAGTPPSTHPNPASPTPSPSPPPPATPTNPTHPQPSDRRRVRALSPARGVSS